MSTKLRSERILREWRATRVYEMAVERRVLSAVVFAVLVAALLVSARPAGAHDTPPNCMENDIYGSDATCSGHWQDSHMLYHWGPEIEQAHHAGHRDRFNSAATGWADATPPANPWHTHFDLLSETHPDMVNSSGDVLGRALITPSDLFFHFPLMVELWLRHDIEEITCSGGNPCQWYTGTGTPGQGSVDAWSVWMEELGHAQNITHHVPAGHENHRFDHTMSGVTTDGNIDKRTLNGHEIFHACDPYRRQHAFC